MAPKAIPFRRPPFDLYEAFRTNCRRDFPTLAEWDEEAKKFVVVPQHRLLAAYVRRTIARVFAA